MDISAEIAAIQAASQGSELRQPLVGALNKLNTGSLPAVTASDVGKILKVGANGWEVGEKSGYMPVPTDTMQITNNGVYDVTDFANAQVNVSGGGGSSVLIPKIITQNGTYDPADDNADGYSSVDVLIDQNMFNWTVWRYSGISIRNSGNISFVSDREFNFTSSTNNSYTLPSPSEGSPTINQCIPVRAGQVVEMYYEATGGEDEDIQVFMFENNSWSYSKAVPNRTITRRTIVNNGYVNFRFGGKNITYNCKNFYIRIL